jgi:hypothetical protein
MPDSPLSITRLAAKLGVDRRAIGRQVGRGCPRDLPGAKEWRARNLRSIPRPRPKRLCHETVTLPETHQHPAPPGASDTETVGEPTLCPGDTNGNGEGSEATNGYDVMTAWITVRRKSSNT